MQATVDHRMYGIINSCHLDLEACFDLKTLLLSHVWMCIFLSPCYKVSGLFRRVIFGHCFFKFS